MFCKILESTEGAFSDLKRDFFHFNKNSNDLIPVQVKQNRIAIKLNTLLKIPNKIRQSERATIGFTITWFRPNKLSSHKSRSESCEQRRGAPLTK